MSPLKAALQLLPVVTHSALSWFKRACRTAFFCLKLCDFAEAPFSPDANGDTMEIRMANVCGQPTLPSRAQARTHLGRQHV
jgi:hypothetical protein